MSTLYEAMKRVAHELDANTAHAKPHFATVRSASPLRIELDNKLVLEEEYFVVAQHLTKYRIDCEIVTEEINGFYVEHEGRHDVQVDDGQQLGHIILDNRLRTGDRVIVMEMEGGEQFVVVDRMDERKERR